jgi:hypothetical protein
MRRALCAHELDNPSRIGRQSGPVGLGLKESQNVRALPDRELVEKEGKCMFEQMDDPKLTLSGPKTLKEWLIEKSISVVVAAAMIGLIMYALMAVE